MSQDRDVDITLLVEQTLAGRFETRISGLHTLGSLALHERVLTDLTQRTQEWFETACNQPIRLARLHAAGASISDPLWRQRARDFACTQDPITAAGVIRTLGRRRDPMMLELLMQLTSARTDRVAARIISGYEASVLEPMMSRLLQVADRTADRDVRLWVGVASATVGAPGLLYGALAELRDDHELWALRGPDWQLERWFRRTEPWAPSIATRLQEWRNNELHSWSSRRVAGFLVGDPHVVPETVKGSTGRALFLDPSTATDIIESIIDTPYDPRRHFAMADNELDALRQVPVSDMAERLGPLWASIYRNAPSDTQAVGDTARVMRTILDRPQAALAGLEDGARNLMSLWLRTVNASSGYRHATAPIAGVVACAATLQAEDLLCHQDLLIDTSTAGPLIEATAALDLPTRTFFAQANLAGNKLDAGLPPSFGNTDGGESANTERVLFHPRLDAPVWVHPGAEFSVFVGLAATSSEGLQGLFVAPESTTFELVMNLVFDGVELVEPEQRTLVTQVDERLKLPLVEVALRATGDDGYIASITVTYFTDGNLAGFANRNISISIEERAAQTMVELADRDQLEPLARSDPDDVDLTLQITNELDGQLRWLIQSPHAAIPTTVASLPVPERSEFAVGLKRRMESAEEQAHRWRAERTKSWFRRLRDAMPSDVWNAIATASAAAAAQRHEPASVLVLSNDLYIPWELADCSYSLIPGAPPPSAYGVLGAQVSMARWQSTEARYHPGGIRDGTLVRPPSRLQPKELVVLVPDYTSVNLEPLPAALKEGTELLAERSRWAVKGDPSYDAVSELLIDQQSADQTVAIHLAAHAISLPEGGGGKIALVASRSSNPEIRYLDSDDIGGLDYSHAPFFFFNACDAGVNDQLLGQPVQLGMASVRAGAGGIVLPLWAIESGAAYEVAKSFYRYVLDERCTIGEALRRIRANAAANGAEAQDFGPVAGQIIFTNLAYQFFGHPNLRISFEEFS